MGRYSSETQRPPTFTLNQQHPLAQGLVFAGLGAHAGSTRYHDSSAYWNTGALTNMDPATDWVWDSTLNRFVTDYDGNNDFVVTDRPSVPAGDFSIGAWALSNGLGAARDVMSQWASGQTGRLTLAQTAVNYVGVYITGSQVAITSAAVIAAATWTHVAVIRTGSSVQIYINAVANGVAGTSSTSIYQTNVRLGTYSSGEYWLGRIGDPFIYNWAVPTTYLQQLADPSNVMLSGLINYPRRKWWPVVSGTPATFKAAWAARRRQVIGGGIT